MHLYINTKNKNIYQLPTYNRMKIPLYKGYA